MASSRLLGKISCCEECLVLSSKVPGEACLLVPSPWPGVSSMLACRASEWLMCVHLVQKLLFVPINSALLLGVVVPTLNTQDYALVMEAFFFILAEANKEASVLSGVWCDLGHIT